MNAIANFLTFLAEYWTLILAVVTAAVAIATKTRQWMALSKDEKKKAAIEAVRRSMLYFVTEAEKEYGGGTGALKRAKVFAEIFKQYPILAQFANVEAVTSLIDYFIDDNLVELRELLENNEAFYDYVNNVMTLTAEQIAEIDTAAMGIPVGGVAE